MRGKHENLLFVEALKDYVVVHTREESYTIPSTMKEVERKLSDRRFIRVHRSYIVNLHAIESIKYSNIRMGASKEIPVGGSYRTSSPAASTCCNPRRHRLGSNWAPVASIHLPTRRTLGR